MAYHSLSPTTSLTSIPGQQTPPGNPKFVHLDQKYICVVCRNVARDAVQTLCGHRSCQQCMEQLLHENPKTMRCPVNEDTCCILRIEEIYRDSSARKEIRLLLVYCTYRTSVQHKNEGCIKTMPWKDLRDHEEVCDFKPMPCNYKDSGCEMIVILRDLPNHVKTCLYRPEKCVFCETTISSKLMEEHQKMDCSMYVIPCMFGCGVAPAPRNEMNRHMQNDCPKRPQKCKYNTIGCEFTGTIEEVRRHYDSGTDQHIQLYTVRNEQVGLDVLQVRAQVQELVGLFQSLKNLVLEQSRQTESLQQNMEEIKQGMKDVKLKVVSQTERIINLERKAANMADKQMFENQRREIMVVRDNHNALTERVSSLERAGPAGGMDLDTIQQHDRQLGLMDLRVAELDLRFQVMETASFNGVLMWKIRDYHRRKQDAKSGKTLSLYSQPFYTSRFGFKMCARIYLNGDGVGKGTHVSLFFVVQRGEYDALLSWPFRQKVTLMLLDQEHGTRHLSDTFRPDVTSSSFKRPVSEMNVASGCPLFVAHSVLETPTFLRDDTIFIKVVVDTEGLKYP